MNSAVETRDPVTEVSDRSLQSTPLAGNPLRVLHVLNRFATGGTEHVVLKLVGGLNGAIFEQRLAALRGMDSAIDQNRIPGGQLLLQGRNDTGFELMLFRLARVMRAYRPHIVHSRNWGAIEAIPAARLAGVPIAIHSEHGYELDMLAGLPTRRRLFRRAAYSMASAVFAVTRELRDFHAHQAWVSPDRIRVIYNGVDTRRFQPQPHMRFSLRQKFGLPQSRFIVGTVGRIVDIKDHPTLLRAIEIMLRGGVDAHALIVGSGPELERNQQLVRDSSALSGRVTFIGSSDEVPELLNAMDAFALTSISEGMSNTLLEAMASGLPVVVTSVGGNPEVVVEGSTGCLFQPRDAETLASRLALLASQNNLRSSYGAEARERVVTSFGLERMLDDYSQLYLELAARRGIKLPVAN
ncbi:MAG: glycosyltransferase [Candidatus Acidiferrales bacterium]